MEAFGCKRKVFRLQPKGLLATSERSFGCKQKMGGRAFRTGRMANWYLETVGNEPERNEERRVMERFVHASL